MNWKTVKDIAGYLQLSEMMIYKLAQQGKIPATKIGRVWRFSESAIEEWMKNKNVVGETGEASGVVDQFCAKLGSNLGNSLVKIVLFGSRARGDNREDSDLDLLVVLKDEKLSEQTKNSIFDIAYDISYGSGNNINIAPVIIGEKEYLTGMSPLIINIRKEGKLAA